MFFHILAGKRNKCKSSLTKLLVLCSAKKDTHSFQELGVTLLESMEPPTEPALACHFTWLSSFFGLY